VKPVLDKTTSAVVAEQLRVRGRGVEAVSERRELRGLVDEDLFEYAQAAEQSIVTYSRDDFLELDRRLRSHPRVWDAISSRPQVAIGREFFWRPGLLAGWP
jgi:hypothetical protein